MSKSSKTWSRNLAKSKRRQVQVGDGDGVPHFAVAGPEAYVKVCVVRVSSSTVNKPVWIKQSDLDAIPYRGDVDLANEFEVFRESPDEEEKALRYKAKNLVRHPVTGDLEADILLA